MKKDKEKEPAKKAPKVPKVPKAPEVPKAVKPLAYKPVKTIAEAEKMLESHGVRVDYDGLAVEVTNVANKTIIETMDVAPKLRNTLVNTAATETQRAILKKDEKSLFQYMLMREMSENPTASENERTTGALSRLVKFISERLPTINGALAYSDPFIFGNLDYRGVYLNTYCLNPTNLLETLKDIVFSEQIGFHPIGCNTLKSIIDHELGHEIDRTYAISMDAKINEIFRKWDELETIDMKIKALSKYPAIKEYEGYKKLNTRRAEFIAECWTEYRNNPKPRATAKAVGDRMMEIIKSVENNRHR